MEATLINMCWSRGSKTYSIEYIDVGLLEQSHFILFGIILC